MRVARSPVGTWKQSLVGKFINWRSKSVWMLGVQKINTMLCLCFHPQPGPDSRSPHCACTSRSWTHKPSCTRQYFPHPYSDKSRLLINSFFYPPITNGRPDVQYKTLTNPNAILGIQVPNHRAGGGICRENEWERITLMEMGAKTSKNKRPV